ncbi:hypothetical protein LX64_03360 [Chitinophaga skermanii]|uniref:Uncharacterized protein n=1 Tax=Chitinophaga skermanii TaxID=331697 RepID=A0A327QEP8_9BACT|nr:hypothetical protein [Chitinophaga skermanii]RAJ02348.1 hypothetical protein LX64_03360 [Chitinophaga skermanii]
MQILLSLLIPIITTYHVNLDNSKKYAFTDTLYVVPLTHQQYKQADYKLVSVCELDSNGIEIKSARRILLTQKNKVVASISLPVPDEEVKNFSVHKVGERANSFFIGIDWGGGNYYYEREFNFAFDGKQFVLTSVKMISYVFDTGKTSTRNKKITPPIPVNKFVMMPFIENE